MDSIRLTKHCVEQIRIRKGEPTDEDAKRFAHEAFSQMVSKKRFGGTECVIKKLGGSKESVQQFPTGFKFVYERHDWGFTVITFAIHSHLDMEIGKLLKRLETYRLMAAKKGNKGYPIDF